MGDAVLKCPLCCDKTFNSKPALIEHLTSTYENITCPICQNKWSSIDYLIEHLSLENCKPESAGSVDFEVNSDHESEQTELRTKYGDISIKSEIQNPISDPLETTIKDTTDGSSEIGRMYVELLSKQMMKPCLQTQEMKLVSDGGVSRYVIITDERPNVDTESAVVTKQNNDGTISLTTVKDMKMASDTVITHSETVEAEENQEEIYSCNTCGVSFTSVLDHIQNYHNDQDVVVEEPMDDSETGASDILPDLPSIEFEPLPMEDMTVDKQTSRRMITETGDIIETPMFKRNTITLESNVELDGSVGRVSSRCYVVVDKFCDSVVKDIKHINEKEKNKGPYHKVVIKEMESDNGQRMKVFNCISCNVYVSSLDEFKSHPCKALKYTCPHCSVSYENSKSLCAHMKVHKVKPGESVEVINTPTSYVCEFCSTSFTTHKSLKLHRRMHDPVKVRPIEPPVKALDGGKATGDTYLCPVCLKQIPTDYRIIHQNSHKTDQKFNCDICNKKFNSGEYLEMHMSVHTHEKVTVKLQEKYHPYTCLYCERRFARPHEKVKHERIHTGEKPHSCEICGKSFRVSYCLTLHMRTHTGARPYACPHCGKRFKAHSVYNHHLLTHSEVRAYKCPYCPKAFKTSVQLSGHKNSHTKPFSCQHCNRPFASLYAVRMHTETHSRQNNLKFSCTLCGARYARAFALKDHMKQVHNKEQSLTSIKEDDWIPQPNTDGDAEGLQVTKQLPKVELTELKIINSDELVVPS